MSSSNENYESNVFCVSILGVLIILLIIIIIKRILSVYSFLNRNKFLDCQCNQCKKRLLNINNQIKKDKCNFCFYIYLLLLLIFIICFAKLCTAISNTKIKVFDPYEILNIPNGASKRQIKKAYNTLARKYHPDKSNYKDSSNKFMEITNAYKALTDEKANFNYLTYGHPDGPSYLRIGIAIPKFLMEGVGGNIVVICFIIFILVLPVWFMFWFNNSKKYNNSGMLIINKSIFYFLIEEDIKINELPFIIGLCSEFNYYIKEKDISQLESICEKLKKYEKYFPKVYKNYIDMNKLNYGNFKAILFLYLHYFGKDDLINELYTENEILYIYKKTEIILDNMIETVIEFINAYSNWEIIRESDQYKHMLQCKEFDLNFIKDHIKPYSYMTLLTVAAFKQGLYQYIDITKKKYSIYQLPAISSSNISKLDKINNINELMENPNELNQTAINNTELINIKEALSALPIIKLTLLENEVYNYDDNSCFVSISIQCNRKSQKKAGKKELGLLHSLTYPLNIDESYIAILKNSTNNKIYDMQIFKYTLSNDTYKYKNSIPTAGKSPMKFTLEIHSLNYTGLLNKIQFEVSFDETKLQRIQFKPFDLLYDEYFIENYIQELWFIKEAENKKNK